VDQEQINKDLAEKDSAQSQMQKKLLEYVTKLLKSSSDRMCTYHDSWDNNSHIYRGYRGGDRADAEAKTKDEPPKIIVPITYAQTQTALSFLLSTFLQKPNLYEVVGSGPEDIAKSFALNTDLQYQAQKDRMYLKLYFWLLDAIKQGFGVVRNDWTEKKVKMRVSRQAPVGGIQGIMSMFSGSPMMQTIEAVEEVLSYQGNTTVNISPYAFYPDPSVSLANFQDGHFVATEDEKSLASVKAQEGSMYFGTKFIKNSHDQDLAGTRKRRVRGPFDAPDKASAFDMNRETGKPCIMSDVEFVMSEKELSKMLDMDMGKSPVHVKWLCTVINDSKIVRFERIGNLHGRFNYELIEFSPDHDSFYNPGLSDTIFELQNIITFFLNSHIVNVRKVIANRFLVKEDAVNLDDIKSGSLYVRVKGATADISRVVKQLDAQDITAHHITDMESLTKLVQVITGINENALGQYSSGRRSATEARNVNAGAAARLKMTGQLMWLQGIEPLGGQWLANLRQWRTKEVYDQIVGAAAMESPFEQTILADPERIAGGFDFVPYDATLPSDKQQQAGVLTELFTTLISNPVAMQLLNKNPLPLLEHIAKLHGIKNINDFDMQPLNAPAAQVVSDEEAAMQVDGGAEPIDMAGENLLNSLRSA
jgi:hypothetical protein